MVQTWSSWKRFPDVESGDNVEAPIGPGVYEVRHTLTGRLIAFGPAGNVAQALSELKVNGGIGPIARFFRRPPLVVFTLPSYDSVFKVIKDQFDEPKTTTRAEVMAKYYLVFKHDRAGRLIDAQEFEHLEFDRALFSEPLLKEIQRVAGSTVRVEAGRVVIQHLYIERRLRPLNIYVHEASDEAVQAAVIDYGLAIKNLAAANIFPGDILLKNFGVTRHGRVVSYDYDELCLVTDCNFVAVPPPHDPIEEFSAEPWFSVHENDCFPAELKPWLGLEEPWRSTFLEHHSDLYEVGFWRDLQAQIRAGEVIDILPYPQSKRLSNRV